MAKKGEFVDTIYFPDEALFAHQYGQKTISMRPAGPNFSAEHARAVKSRMLLTYSENRVRGPRMLLVGETHPKNGDYKVVERFPGMEQVPAPLRYSDGYQTVRYGLEDLGGFYKTRGLIVDEQTPLVPYVYVSEDSVERQKKKFPELSLDQPLMNAFADPALRELLWKSMAACWVGEWGQDDETIKRASLEAWREDMLYKNGLITTAERDLAAENLATRRKKQPRLNQFRLMRQATLEQFSTKAEFHNITEGSAWSRLILCLPE